MPKSFRQFILLFMLLVMPLQGIAASLTAVLCASAPASTQPVGEHRHDGAHAPHGDENSSGMAHSGIFCCHHFFAALPPFMADPMRAELPPFDPQHRYTAWLFFPEQPKPVPLA